MENTTPKRKSPVLFIIGAIVLVLAFFGIKWIIHRMHYESTDNAQVESRSIPVLARVAGYIDSVTVDDFGNVKAGQALITIDDQEYHLAVVQAQADVMNANADMANAQAAYSNAVAN